MLVLYLIFLNILNLLLGEHFYFIINLYIFEILL